MRTILVTAPNSGSGKTTVTIGLIKALRDRGLTVAPFKTGPDYIDTAFLAAAAGRPAGNLDLHLQGLEGLGQALALADGDVAIIEGAMGYFDGMHNTSRGSSHDIASILNVPAVLVYRPQGEMFTAVPKIKGLFDFAGGQLQGIILNGIPSRMGKLLQEQLEKHIPTRVLGTLPEIPGSALESRHLGLIQHGEVADADEKIAALARAMAAHIDLDALLSLARKAPRTFFPRAELHELTVGVALDKAFSFYYRENLRLLDAACRVVYFSPLEDRNLPPCDLLYLGGGYPEVYREELAANREMRENVRAFAEGGGCIFAECGGMLYLNKAIEDSPMVGIFPGRGRLTSRLQRFGYVNITLLQDGPLGQAGDRLKGHEFHRSVCEPAGEALYGVEKPGRPEKWRCGYRYKNVIAAYPHLHFLGNMTAFENLLRYASRIKKAGS